LPIPPLGRHFLFIWGAISNLGQDSSIAITSAVAYRLGRGVGVDHSETILSRRGGATSSYLDQLPSTLRSSYTHPRLRPTLHPPRDRPQRSLSVILSPYRSTTTFAYPSTPTGSSSTGSWLWQGPPFSRRPTLVEAVAAGPLTPNTRRLRYSTVAH